MSTINNTDLLLVERNNVQYKVAASNAMSTLLDTDLLIVGRGDSQYKVTGGDFKNQYGTGVNLSACDTSKNWMKYWTGYSGSNDYEVVGSWYVDAPCEYVFNGFDSDGSGGIPVSQAQYAWFLGLEAYSSTSWEFCYWNEVTVAADFNIWHSSGGVTSTFSLADTNGNTGIQPGRHVYTSAQTGQSGFYGISFNTNYGTQDRLVQGSQKVRFEYIKVNGKTLYDTSVHPKF